MLTIKPDVTSALEQLYGLLARVEDPSPVLRKVGEALISSTMDRFATGTAPDGSSWDTNSDTTKAIYNGLFARPRNKKPLVEKKPLVGESRRLSREISWQLDGRAVEIGSPMPYANMQQFGGTKAQWPHLWGDIPARPYLGISSADEASILDIVRAYLAPD